MSGSGLGSASHVGTSGVGHALRHAHAARRARCAARNQHHAPSIAHRASCTTHHAPLPAGNGLADPAALCIANALALSSTHALRRLWVDRNEISTRGARALVAAALGAHVADYGAGLDELGQAAGEEPAGGQAAGGQAAGGQAAGRARAVGSSVSEESGQMVGAEGWRSVHGGRREEGREVGREEGPVLQQLNLDGNLLDAAEVGQLHDLVLDLVAKVRGSAHTDRTLQLLVRAPPEVSGRSPAQPQQSAAQPSPPLTVGHMPAGGAPQPSHAVNHTVHHASGAAAAPPVAHAVTAQAGTAHAGAAQGSTGDGEASSLPVDTAMDEEESEQQQQQQQQQQQPGDAGSELPRLEDDVDPALNAEPLPVAACG